jgi:hypothetical protein
LLEEAFVEDFVTSTLPELDTRHRRDPATLRDSMVSKFPTTKGADGLDEKAVRERGAKTDSDPAEERRGPMARTNACRWRSANVFIAVGVNRCEYLET